MTASGAARGKQTLTVVAIVALACIAALLVYFALRTDPVPTAGETPVVSPPASGAAATPEPTPTPSASAAPAGTAPAASGRFLDAADARVAARATAGSCTGGTPLVEVTADGGTSWQRATLPPEDQIRQIVGLRLVSADQIDLVVLAGPGCTANLLTSYTGGQFWELYPERLATTSYLDASDPAKIVIGGVAVAAPCARPLELNRSGDSTAVRCADITAVTSGSGGSWRPVTALGLYGLDWRGDDLIGGVSSAEACDGLVLTAFPGDGSDLDGVAAGCAPVDSDLSSVAIAAAGDAVWIWSESGMTVSTDEGTSWTEF